MAIRNIVKEGDPILILKNYFFFLKMMSLLNT